MNPKFERHVRHMDTAIIRLFGYHKFIKTFQGAHHLISKARYTTSWCLLLLIASCSKQYDTGRGRQTLVNVTLDGSVYEEVIDYKRGTASASLQTEAAEYKPQVIPFGEDFLLSAELKPLRNDMAEIEPQAGGVQKTQPDSKAAIETTPLNPGIHYRLVVYTAAGNYVTEREYVRDQEASTEPLLLTGGETYIFVAYSINTAATTPSVTFTGGIQTLANSLVSITGGQDFMYFQRQMTIDGNNTNFLGIVLRHRLSQITTTIDASATGYNINLIGSTFTPHNTLAEVPLATGLPNRTGNVSLSTVTFPTLGSQIITSNPTMINAPENTSTSYQISLMRIGSMEQGNMTALSGLTVTPGVRYNLTVRVLSNDVFTTLSGQDVALINGRYWMRYNLGANTSLDPDQLPSVQGLHGNYYQWGRRAVVATQSTTHLNISGWDWGTGQAGNSWNLGNQTTPIKNTTNDPCPSGFRVPTESEWQNLLNNTNASEFGTYVEGSIFTNVKILQSARNANVRLSFPIAGGRHPDGGYLSRRGRFGFYSTSTRTTGVNARRIGFNQTGEGFDNSAVSWGSSVRCIND